MLCREFKHKKRYIEYRAAKDSGIVVIAEEDVTTASWEHKEIKGLLVDPTMEFIADCDDATAQAQVWTSVKFKDKATADNGTAWGNIKIIAVLPNKKAIVKFA